MIYLMSNRSKLKVTIFFEKLISGRARWGISGAL